MDITKILPEDGRTSRMPVKVGGQVVAGMSIELRHMDSPSVRAVSIEVRERRARRGTVDVKADEQDQLDIYVAATCSWSGFDRGTEAITCTPENVKAVYAGWPALVRQVDDWVSSEGNFVKVSSLD